MAWHAVLSTGAFPRPQSVKQIIYEKHIHRISISWSDFPESLKFQWRPGSCRYLPIFAYPRKGFFGGYPGSLEMPSFPAFEQSVITSK
jgi:hypothetical protein